MASKIVEDHKVSSESKKIHELINEFQDFLLSGGAGSGKTHALVEVIELTLKAYPLTKVACITYTNAAVSEIEERVNHPNLFVSTIHEFLWTQIKGHQVELKALITELIDNEDELRFKVIDTEIEGADYFSSLEKGIQYKEYVQIKNGIISHDELLIIAEKMFERYPKLCKLTQSTYPYLFIDEYQDTDPKVVSIFLDHFPKIDKKSVTGFFGDSMQSIYDGSVGNLDDYIGGDAPQIIEVKIVQNRRNPKRVIDLANRLRLDGLQQKPSPDTEAPNMNSDGVAKEGEVLFLYSEANNINKARIHLGWDFDDSKNTKELNLTHNLIAKKAGFEDLMRVYDSDKITDYVKRIKRYIKRSAGDIDTEGLSFNEVINKLKDGKKDKELKAVLPTNGMKEYIEEHKGSYQQALHMPYDNLAAAYTDKDHLLDDKKNHVGDDSKLSSQRDDIVNHLFRIQRIVRLYKDGCFNEFIRSTDFTISSVSEKKQLKVNIESLLLLDGKSIKDVITLADQYGLVLIDDRLNNFIEKKIYLYAQISDIPYSQFINLYNYLEGFTPFSTKHKTKGAEFSNVLIILDNGNWNNYNFEGLFTEGSKQTVLERTQKIFYVCCTRSKEKLAVYYHNPPKPVLDKASDWFGNDNIINLDSLLDAVPTGHIFRSIDEPIRNTSDFDEKWRGEDGGLITCWEVGRAKSIKHPDLAKKALANELPVLGWKGGAKSNPSYGSLNYLAQWQGLRNKDLSINPSVEIKMTCDRLKSTVIYTADSSKYT